MPDCAGGDRNGIAANPVPRVAFIVFPINTFLFLAPLPEAVGMPPYLMVRFTWGPIPVNLNRNVSGTPVKEKAIRKLFVGWIRNTVVFQRRVN
jgi:hypothetical protein